jgi:hypothetical protein
MLSELINKIKIFSELSDQECAILLRDHFLEALESDTYIDWDIVTKFIVTSYSDREALCKFFNAAVKKNIQKIGPYTIGDWIRRYQDRYLGKERNPNTFFEYISNEPDVKKLSPYDRLLVARVLRIYDYLLVIPIGSLDGPVSSILRFAMRPNPEEARTRAPRENIDSMQSQSQPARTAPQRILKITLSEGLAKFDKLGEQVVSSRPLQLSFFPSPVRPSVKNWIADYHETYGNGIHSEMNRADFLFKSDNAKMLSGEERQKVAHILKSLDLELPVDIDPDAQQIVFQKNEPAQRAQETRDERQGTNLEILNSKFPTSPTSRQIPNNYPGQRASFQKNSPQALPTRPIRNSFSEESRQENPFSRNNFQGTNNIQSPNPKSQTNFPQNSAPRATNQETRPTDPLRNNFSEADRQAQAGNMIFSSPQKLPYESEAPMRKKNSLSFPPIPADLPIKTPPPSAPSRQNTIVLQKKPDPPRPEGKNVVDLREG